MWVKGDMINTVAFHRLDFASFGKDPTGRRIYYRHRLSADQIKYVRRLVLSSIGLISLTKHL